jgi:GR25 family glycosyltransferase involved in LPS biosynthesis
VNLKRIKIKKYYMITLDTSSRFEKHYGGSSSIKSRVTKFPAIDSRQDFQKTCAEKGYKVNVKPEYRKHFDRCKGSYGCTLSHASIYELIKNKPIEEYYCVLEDDVVPRALEKFIAKEEHVVPANAVVINLIGGINSSAGYLLTAVGAQILLKGLNGEITAPQDKFMFKHCQKRHPSRFSVMRSLKRYVPTDYLDPKQRDLI